MFTVPKRICHFEEYRMKQLSIAKTLLSGFPRTLALFFLLTWAVFLAGRAAMLALVWDGVGGEPFAALVHALYVGAKFDMRMAVFGLIPLGVIFAVPALERALPRLRPWLDALYGVLFFCVAVVYAVDFGYFFYLRQRVDVSLFEFLGNADISLQMVWESYPVVFIALGLMAVTAVYAVLADRVLRAHRLTPARGWKRRTGLSLAVFALCFLMAYGQLSSNLFPLRWSDAYFSVNKDLTLLALNPIQNLRDSAHSMHGIPPDMDAVRRAYPEIAAWLRVADADPETLNLLRRFSPGGESAGRRLNVVIIVMESLAWPKTSFAPNHTATADDTTPNLAALARESALFSNFFAPARTTARAMFTTITGVPDVNRSGGTSSRNPFVVDQFVLMNEFQGYEKFYMIGGSASWANIRGVFASNIDGLQLLEEGAWKAPNVDVWGVSDLALLREAAEKLDAARQPFVAVVQTAGFHRPYTIPDDNAGFALREPSPEVMRNYGFTGADEYNSLRFSDHALGEFFRAARGMPWFDRTVFAIFGDHGLNDPPGNMPPGYTACHLQDSHVPLLIYAPGLAREGLFKPGVYPQPCGQPDVFPTLAALAGVPFRYTGMGRDLFDPDTRRDARQFVAGNNEAFMRLVEDGYCYITEAEEGLYRLDDPDGRNLLGEEPDRAARMRRFAADYFNISKYLLYNNKKRNIRDAAGPLAP